jgi:putative membrane protein
MMIKDHTEANGKIKELAASHHVEVPSRVSNDKADMIGKLNKKDRSDFDKAYIDMMVDDHQEDIKEFEEAGNKINDTQVKQFINSTLPVLRKHLDSCTAIRDALKNK